MEVIIAMMLLGSVFLVLATGLLTVTRTTQTNERIQSIDSGLISYGEILRSQVGYRNCVSGLAGATGTYTMDARPFMRGNPAGPTTSTTEHPHWAMPHGMAITDVWVVRVDSWNPATGTWATGCLTPDSGAQRIRYAVRMAGTVRGEAEIVKRRCGEREVRPTSTTAPAPCV